MPKIDKYHRKKTARDDEYIAAYLKYHSQEKAAKECGVGRTAISHACYRAGIEMTGQRKKGRRKGGSPDKITDAELLEESKTMTRAEIAEKHNMNICNVDRRRKRLGIKCKPATATRATRIGTSHHYSERCKAYGVEYDKDVTLKKVIQRDNGICQICGRPVDIEDKGDRCVGALYPSIDHIIPLSKGGGHTWDNVQLAHMICNSIKCDGRNKEKTA